MKHACFLLLAAVALAWSFAGSAAAQDFETNEPPRIINGHKFGMEWKPGQRPGALEEAAVAVTNVAKAWEEMPSRIERAVSWTVFGNGVIVGGVGLLALLLAFNLAATKVLSERNDR